MCTVIPYDNSRAEEVKLSPKQFLQCLEMVDICPQKQVVDNENEQRVQVDMNLAKTATPPEEFFRYLYNVMKANPAACVFEVEGAQYFVSCLMALMLWCIREEDRAVCVHVVLGVCAWHSPPPDSKFIRPDLCAL